ncbi:MULTISPECIES: MoaD family protein [Eubacterium]|uniref:MoaD family protein n=2 Tax=Eubacterium TaxID=1730 RepID=A0ABT5UK65_EUBLI|nr:MULTISPECIES: MoaD family protein [Eubacterium]MCB6569710.1 MoaD family protein [Eubacterium limosum]MDE1469118.1 MoaD family protein [Eubacterium limosum]NZA39594.1 MoaD family protein [Eubacterium callanderi]
MKVKFFATIRNYTGCRQAEVPVCKDMYTLLHTLSETYGDAFRNHVLSPDGEAPGAEIILMVDGRHIEHLQGLKTPLNENSAVAIFPVVAGG